MNENIKRAKILNDEGLSLGITCDDEHDGKIFKLDMNVRPFFVPFDKLFNFIDLANKHCFPGGSSFALCPFMECSKT